MIPPAQRHWYIMSVGVFARSIRRAGLHPPPLYRFADKFVCDLNPGEALLIPIGWWHHVRALDVSISVSFTNFQGAFRNG